MKNLDVARIEDGFRVYADWRSGYTPSIFSTEAAPLTSGTLRMENHLPDYSIRGQSSLAAIVITDGVAFSARMASDEEHTLSLIQRDLKLMRELCTHFEGQVLKSTGDGLLMYFTSARQAVACALEIQTTLVKMAATSSPQNVLVHRIGIHLGDVFLSETDVMGNGVNIAARLQTEASPWGICMSQTVYDVVKAQLRLDATYLGPLQLKNIQETVPAYQVLPTSSIPNVGSDAAPGQSATPPDEIRTGEARTGKLINQRYRIEKILGRGGFGLTYLASDTQRFDDLCVLKEFFPTSKTDYIVEKARNLFEREARTLYQINHPQIPKFLAWFTDQGRLFIVQEYINGKTYSSLLKERKQNGRLFSEVEVVQWLTNILPVLNYLHSLNIVHRDISPDNVMLPYGRSLPMLIDFGLVKQTVVEMWAIDSEANTMTGQASFVGKLGYAPPEQIRMGQCFPCSDLYALGVTAVVFLTGKEPGMLMDQGSLEWQWRPFATVSDRLAEILNQMLAEKPRDRYQSAQDVLHDLAQLDPDRMSAVNLRPSRSTAPGLHPQGYLPAVHPDLIERCQQELTQRIGPIASCVVNDVLSMRSPKSAEELIEALAAEIPNAQHAQDFRETIISDVASLTTLGDPTPALASPPPPPQPQTSPSVDLAQTHPPAADSGQARLDPVFIDRCRRELARCIGPMASLIIDDVLSNSPALTAQELIWAIASEIPDAKQSREFQQRLL